MKKISLLLIVAFCISSALSHAQVPQLLEYDGFLSGNVTGNRTMGLRLYNASTNGTILYKETIGTVKVTNGEFYFQYGQNGTLGNGTTPTTISAVLTGSQNWLAVTVNGTEQTPRTPLLSVPFALRSSDAQKTDADLRQVVDAVGKVVVAFGGNASNLLSNPAAAIATMESAAKNVLEMQKRFRVIGLSGNLSFGSSLTSRQLTISNTGFDRLTVSGISYPAGFSGNWSGVVPAGGSQIVAVTFAPSAVQAYSGNITVSSDAMAGVSVLPVSGTGERAISVQGNLTFGNVLINTTATRNFTISNTGTMNLTVTGITYPPRFSGNWSGTIPPGGSQTITATYAPNAAQTNSGNLSVASNAAGRSGILAVNGAGILAGTMVTVQAGTLPQSSQLAGQTVSTFQIGKYEVTCGEWKNVRDWAVANGYTDLAGVGDTYPTGSADNFPVINVSWYDVCKWSNAKSEKEGLTPVYQVSGATYKTGESVPTVNSVANGYRLPLEKEWEWAARGGVSSQGYTYSGSNDLNAVAWYDNNNNNGIDGSKAVGTKVANELGIYDMTGNAFEWCWDAYDPYSTRRLRGGGYSYTADYCNLAVRFVNYYPGLRSSAFGFRLARNSGN